jgi:hypothetical protein
MKFLLIILTIRYVFRLLDKISVRDEKVCINEYENEEDEKIIHPSEFKMRLN